MLKVLLSRKMLTITLLGMTSGVPLGVVLTIIQVWFTDTGIDLKTIGLISLVQLPYTVKFLWSPFMERFRLPFLGRRQGWMLISQIGLMLSIGGMGMFDPKEHTQLIVAFAVLISFLGASHDIMIDGYRRDILEDEELGFGSAVATNSYLVGFRFLSVVIGLMLGDILPWSQVFLVLAALPLIGIIGTLISPKALKEISSPKSIKEAVIGPFAEYLKRPGAFEILLFILLYKVGDNLAANLLTPFYLKIGFTKTHIAWVGKMVGFWSMFAGGFIGGVLLVRFSIRTCLLLFGVLQALAILAFIPLADGPAILWQLGTAVGLENLTAGMGTAAFSAFMLRLCDRRFSATQYALLTSFMGIPRTIIPSLAGYIADPLGWNAFFTICACTAIPGIAMVYFRSESWKQGLPEK